MNYNFDNNMIRRGHFQLKQSQAEQQKLSIQKQKLKKPSGYGHIRMRSTLMKSEKVINKTQQDQYSQLANIISLNNQYPKQKISFPIYQQKNSSENLKLRSTSNPYTKLTKRPVSSYQNSIYPCREINITHPLPLRNKIIKPITLSECDMESMCSKMSQSIILSTDTVQSLTSVPVPVKLSNDCFQRIKFLGQGKFGQVHLVRHKLTGFICAMKIVAKKIIKEEGIQSQIAKQLRIHSKLKSINIIGFYGFFDDKDYFYILLQYAAQGSVFSKLRGKSRLQQYQLQPIAKGLCDGLRLIHLLGFIHRDIKPENIVMQFGVAKICDFGWATDCDQTHLCKSYCGTPLYLSPEVIKKQFYGTSVDIWAVGLVVYQLLVGRVPFRVWNQQDMSQILTRSIEFPEYIDRSPNCQSFIRKCLQKKTYNRMQLSQALKHPFITESNTNNKLSYQMLENVNKLLTKID